MTSIRCLAALVAVAVVFAVTGCRVDAPDAAGRHVTIMRVLDGDTIAVSPGDERVRILTVNTPERHVATHATPDCGADAAWHALQGLLPAGTTVTLTSLPGEPAKDRYGRTLSNVYVAHAGQVVNVSLWMVDQGWAVTYLQYPTVDTPQAKALQAQAQRSRRGMWATCPTGES